jgi:uncharacterized protein YceK
MKAERILTITRLGLVSACLCLSLTGCASTLTGRDDGENKIYRGTRFYLNCLFDGCLSGWGLMHGSWLMLAVDLPLSFVVDTVILPYSVTKTILDINGSGLPIAVNIPRDYVGWVILHYEDPLCPPFSRSKQYRVMTVSGSGLGCTSDHEPLWIVNFVYGTVDEAGAFRESLKSRGNDHPILRMMIWEGTPPNDAKQTNYPRKTFFVGTQEEFENVHISTGATSSARE